nr:TPM domain-containing protein [Mangrovitalea sediminis]
MAVRVWAFALLMLTAPWSVAAPQFPALTGPVVDDAHMLSAQAQQQLSAELRAFEQKTTNQLVVVTLPDLQGYTIEDFGYQLGRHWGIGQKEKNNGVLLIVAKKERKVRIEVGYGLEGQLTDALSSRIIQGIILPDFRKGQVSQGIVDGAGAIIALLQGDATAIPKARDRNPPSRNLFSLIFVIVIGIMVFGSFFGGGGGGFGRRRGGFWYGGFGGPGGGFGGGLGGGGGFSGGGGGFGGGGASGGW